METLVYSHFHLLTSISSSLQRDTDASFLKSKITDLLEVLRQLKIMFHKTVKKNKLSSAEQPQVLLD